MSILEKLSSKVATKNFRFLCGIQEAFFQLEIVYHKEPFEQKFYHRIFEDTLAEAKNLFSFYAN